MTLKKTAQGICRTFLLVTLLCVLLTACSGQAEEAAPTIPVQDTAGDNSLTVYCYYYTDAFPGMSAATLRRETEKLFYKTIPETVEVIYYDPTGGDTTMDYATAMEHMMTDIMVGKGPDLILGDCDYDRIAGTDITKQARAGLFADLTPYLKGDERFADMPEALLASGQVNGVQYVLPLTYGLGVHMSFGDALDACGLSEADFSGDMAADITTLQNFLDGRAPRSIFYNCKYLGDPMYLLAYLWPSPETLREGMDTELFQQVMELLKTDKDKSSGLLDNAQWESYTYAGETYRDLLNRWELEVTAMTRGAAPWIGGFHSAANLAAIALALDPMGGAVVTPLTNDQGGCSAQVMNYAVISRSTTNIEQAYAYLDAFYDTIAKNDDFGNYFTAGDWQGQLEQSLRLNAANGIGGLSLSFGELPWFDTWRAEMEAQYRAQMEERQEEYAKSHPDETPEPITIEPGQFDWERLAIPENFMDQITAWNEAMTGAFYSYVPYEIVQEAFAPYFAGDASYGSCLSEAMFQLDLYLSE